MDDRDGTRVWTIEPGASLQSVLGEPLCPPLLSKVLTSVHSWQMRTGTSVARTLRASHLLPGWIAALLAMGARVELDETDGSREVPLDALIRGTTKGDVTAVHVPIPGSNTVWGEASVSRTPSDDPIVAAIAVVTLSEGMVEQARVALTGAWGEGARLVKASDALVGAPLTRERIATVATSIEDEVNPEGDYRGSEAYRRAVAGVLTRRALEQCLVREGDDE